MDIYFHDSTHDMYTWYDCVRNISVFAEYMTKSYLICCF